MLRRVQGLTCGGKLSPGIPLIALDTSLSGTRNSVGREGAGPLKSRATAAALRGGSTRRRLRAMKDGDAKGSRRGEQRKAKAAERRARAAHALRANLRRRKAQARERGDLPGPPPESPDGD